MNTSNLSPMATEKPGFWHTTIGMVTAIGGLLGSLATLIGTLAAVGAFSSEKTSASDTDYSPPASPAVVVVPTTDSANTTTVEATGYTLDFESSFIGECSQQPGASVSSCECVLHAAEAEWTYDEFVQLFNAPTMDPGLALIVEYCVNNEA